jgi:hypothetical protein
MALIQASILKFKQAEAEIKAMRVDIDAFDFAGVGVAGMRQAVDAAGRVYCVEGHGREVRLTF